ncbi:hypothetical protein [Hymenobacter sp. BT559]|uniref:hypothetical protein n=1 Tax=Hymenobacter sp. BT559 TaxID=2795729 RepID=UPI0018ED0BB9|nr:hypothetical protein [Hymenobacter sp. BT559]MBJ6141805.1 hypothetical protein [Hymenobacter sp. BT559]
MSPYDAPAVSAGEIADYLDQLQQRIQPDCDSANNSARHHQPEQKLYHVAQEDPLK